MLRADVVWRNIRAHASALAAAGHRLGNPRYVEVARRIFIMIEDRPTLEEIYNKRAFHELLECERVLRKSDP